MFRSKTSPAFPVALTLISAFALGGCAGTPRLDKQFGDSVRAATAQQTLHRDAWRNTDPVTGMDGRAADGAYESYQKSYKTPEPQQNVFLIGSQSH